MFTLVEIFLLSVAVAIDCFTVSLASGMASRRFDTRFVLTTALCFGLFQAFMPYLGWQGTVLVGAYIKMFDHWIAFLLLAFIGYKMITDKSDDNESKPLNKSLWYILTLSVATSIDALAVGVTFSCVGYIDFSQLILPLTIIGITSFLFSIAGFIIGMFFGRKIHFRMEIVGGIILILIGAKILIEHCCE